MGCEQSCAPNEQQSAAWPEEPGGVFPGQSSELPFSAAAGTGAGWVFLAASSGTGPDFNPQLCSPVTRCLVLYFSIVLGRIFVFILSWD